MNVHIAKDWVQVLTLAGTALSFSYGVIQYMRTQHVQSDTRRIEATRPFLDRQLKLYTDATTAAAIVATTTSEEERAKAMDQLLRLYWGELALVEDEEVESAMVHMRKVLLSSDRKSDIEQASLRLAHACRNSLARSWKVDNWRNPHDNPRTPK